MYAFADITIELRSMGVPWTLHCWMNALAAAHELRLDTVIDQLLQDFLQVCPDDYSQQFVTECLPLLFSIFRYSKVCVWNNFMFLFLSSFVVVSHDNHHRQSIAYTILHTRHFSSLEKENNEITITWAKRSNIKKKTEQSTKLFLFFCVIFHDFVCYVSCFSLNFICFHLFYTVFMRRTYGALWMKWELSKGKSTLRDFRSHFLLHSHYTKHKTTKKKRSRRNAMMMIFPPKTTTDSSLSEL